MQLKNKQILVIIIFTWFTWCNRIFAQDSHNLQVSCNIKGKSIDFSQGVNLEITINGKISIPLMYKNGFIIPEISDSDKVALCFIYKNKRYFFSKVPLYFFKPNYVCQPNWILIVKKKTLFHPRRLIYELIYEKSVSLYVCKNG